LHAFTTRGGAKMIVTMALIGAWVTFMDGLELMDMRSKIQTFVTQTQIPIMQISARRPVVFAIRDGPASFLWTNASTSAALKKKVALNQLTKRENVNVNIKNARTSVKQPVHAQHVRVAKRPTPSRHCVKMMMILFLMTAYTAVMMSNRLSMTNR